MKNYYLGKGQKAASSTPMEAPMLYKQSNLKLDARTGEIRLLSVCFPEATTGISVNADAECHITDNFIVGIGNREWTLKFPGHKELPSRRCRCGFHAYREYDDAKSHDQGGQEGHFVIGVVASGKMFEYNKGYRYGHQRLEEVIVSLCGESRCYKFADRLLVGRTGKITPICGRCSENTLPSDVIMSFSEFEEAASKGLPSGAPRITIRSSSRAVAIWDRWATVGNTDIQRLVDQARSFNTRGQKVSVLQSWLNPETVLWVIICAVVPATLLVVQAMNQY